VYPDELLQVFDAEVGERHNAVVTVKTQMRQPKAKRALQEIWMAETKAGAELPFYDFPAEHWKHLRTTNPIESTFATVRHRTIRSKGCLSNRTALAMVFKLLEAAQKPTDRQPITAAA
jgi:putative transposase